MTKRCPGCERQLPFSEFWANRTRPDGLQYRCKRCLNEKMTDARARWEAKAGQTHPTHKRCTRCKRRKVASGFHKSKFSVDGLVSRCKLCLRELHTVQEYRPKRRLAKYGLTAEAYQQLEAAAAGACQICTTPFGRTPVIDHCHATNKVRGLLCSRCNVGLGNFKDDPERLQRALAYLQANGVG